MFDSDASAKTGGSPSPSLGRLFSSHASRTPDFPFRRCLIDTSRIFDYRGQLIPKADLKSLGFRLSRGARGKDIDSLLPPGWKAFETADSKGASFMDVRDAQNRRRAIGTFAAYDGGQPNLVLFPRMVLDRDLFTRQDERLTQFILRVSCEDGPKKFPLGPVIPVHLATPKVLQQTESLVRAAMDDHLPGWGRLTSYWDAVPFAAPLKPLQTRLHGHLGPMVANLEKAATQHMPVARSSSNDGTGKRPLEARTKEGRPIVPDPGWNSAAAEVSVMERFRSEGLGIFAPA